MRVTVAERALIEAALEYRYSLSDLAGRWGREDKARVALVIAADAVRKERRERGE